MNKAEAKAIVQKLSEAQSAIWMLVGASEVWHSGFEIVDGPWALVDEETELQWVEDELQSAMVFRSAVWKGEHYTMVIVYGEGAYPRPHILDNDMWRESLEEEP